jgi:hypothetical protein
VADRPTRLVIAPLTISRSTAIRWELGLSLAACTSLLAIGGLASSSDALVTALQIFLPYIVVALAAITALAAWRECSIIAVVAATVTAFGLAIMAPAMSVLPGCPASADAGPSLTIAHANLLYASADDPLPAVQALADRDVDLIAMSEFTPAHEEALDGTVGSRFPYRAGVSSPDSTGIALWSRIPLDDVIVEPLPFRLGVVDLWRDVGR